MWRLGLSQVQTRDSRGGVEMAWQDSPEDLGTHIVDGEN